MSESEIEDLLRLSISKWGKNLQRILMVEECSELVKVICKEIRAEKCDRLNKAVCEELADVKIMLKQMELIYSPELIKKFEAEKLLRLKERLEE